VTALATLVRTTRFATVPDMEIAPLSYLFLLYPGFRSAADRSAPFQRGLPMQVSRV
jgi:hypothetical protein